MALSGFSHILPLVEFFRIAVPQLLVLSLIVSSNLSLARTVFKSTLRLPH